ncbi:MAG TPA: PA2779 family protein [Terriglobales bacterium]|nr:PA2779 family protein [Terriglobales bacterium]
MQRNLQQVSQAVITCILLLFTLSPSLMAQTHVVSPSELQKQISEASQARQQNLGKVQQFLSTETAQKALQTAHIDSSEVKNAVSTLSDSELAQLAAKADKAQHDFAAGALDNRDIIYIILGVAVLILIIVAVR